MLQAICLKAEKLALLLQGLYDSLILEFEDQIEKTTNGNEALSVDQTQAEKQSSMDEDEQLALILAKIKQEVPESQVYQLAYRMELSILETIPPEQSYERSASHYHLLLIVKGDISPEILGLQNCINNDPDIAPSLFLSIFNTAQVQEALNQNDPFFMNVLRKSCLLYSQSDNAFNFILPKNASRGIADNTKTQALDRFECIEVI